ncbi:glycosyltransferase 87 family protein [Qaidamihabitans albus]|uniref:glycosyltransferase 87 family protein n=1 Tax=Qaidamihabitans albus TaxID=2795733 RepID=UPI0018F1695C|nr:glycosyltransferase 87 family protein [Qaidamihabitans albus]
MATRLVPLRLRPSWNERPLPLDAAFYLVCAGYALVIALTDKHYGFRVWGTFAVAGYGLAFVHTCWLLLTPRLRPGWWRSRWVGVAAVVVVAMLAPLVTLVGSRLGGGDWARAPGAWSAQPEVWVIERSATLLLDHGTPYVDVGALGRPPVVNDYTPYGPVMALFGLPRALLGGTPVADALTDARLVFILVAALCAWASLRLLGSPRVPVRGAQLALIGPFTALTWTVAGPDLAVVGLLVLSCALAATDRPVLAAVVLAAVASAKLIVLPAAAVLAALVLTRLGARALAGFAAVFVAMCAALNVPVLLADPAAFTEHVIRFPAGLGAVSSPAASPLPGHLIAGTGATGRAIAFALLFAAALLILAWLIRRPPRTGADALLRIAVGLAAFTLLTPATRFGYLVYPFVLLGAMLCFPDRTAAPPGTAESGRRTSATSS